MSHLPLQPIGPDKDGTLRFRENSIVTYLLENSGIDMNHLARQDFPQEDREQFAQLIGYSLKGFAELSYVSEETFQAASRFSTGHETEEQARIIVLKQTLKEIRNSLKNAACVAFRIHPDDLKP